MTPQPFYSFWEFLTRHSVEIPIIQRDYAQGRSNQRYLRHNFLQRLKEALDNPQERHLTLDFVYGQEEHGCLYPLDGQQRLTTLWLLHWYIALRAGQLAAAAKVLCRFTYQTRLSSRAFCESLCRPELLAAYNLGGEHQPTGSVCDYLTGRTWFYAHWKQDPTIQSMLRMIGGTPSEHATPTHLVDGLEPLFADCNEADFQTYWERLTGGSAPIGFYYLPLREFGLADNLYIKMNARGKQLTPFEHFKADLIDHIHHQAQQHGEHSAWSALLDAQTGLPLKMDTSWTDLFWSTTHQVQPADRPEGRVDEIYFAFVNRYLLHSAIIRANATEQSPAWLLYPEGGDDSALTYFAGFQPYKELLSEASPTILQGLERVMEHMAKLPCSSTEKGAPDGTLETLRTLLPHWAQFDIIPTYQPLASKEESIPQDKPWPVTPITQPQRVILFGACRYLEQCDTFDPKSYRAWMRVVCNLVENPKVDTIESMRYRMQLIDELSLHATDIYSFLASGDAVQSNAAADQLAEERTKAAKILAPHTAEGLPPKPAEWEDQRPWDWEEAIRAAEESLCFHGTIRCLYQTDSATEVDWSLFDQKLARARQLLPPDIDNTSRNPTLLCHLISLFTEWPQMQLFGRSVLFSNQPDNWKQLLNAPELSLPVHKLLLEHGDVLQLPTAPACDTLARCDQYFEDEQTRTWRSLCQKELMRQILQQMNHNGRLKWYVNHYAVYPPNARADRNIYIIGSPRNTLLDECFNDGSLQPYPEENRQIEATPFFWGRDIPFLYRGKGFVWLSNDHIARYDPTRGGKQGDGEAVPFCREALLALLDELLTPAHGQEAAE